MHYLGARMASMGPICVSSQCQLPIAALPSKAVLRKTALRSSSGLSRALRDAFVMSKPASHKVLEKALAVELEGLQKIHVAVAKQITRLQCEEAVLQELLEEAKAVSAQQLEPAAADTSGAVVGHGVGQHHS